MWHASLAKSEYAKVGSFIPESLAVATLLKVSGYNVPFWHYPLYYLVIMVIAAVVGRFLAYIGVAKINATYGNQHNPEIQEIITLLKEKK